MKKLQNITSKGVRNRVSIAILITAAALMLLITGLQQYYSRKQIRDDLESDAEVELVIKALDVKHSLEEVELALRNRSWEFEKLLPYPDSLFSISRRVVEENPNFDGCCIAMVPDYYPEKGRLFEPYTAHRGNVIETIQLASEEHDYTKNADFILAVENDSSFWSEPYHDEDDPNVTLITYTFPIYDASGSIVGIVGVDYITEKLGKMLNARHQFPSSYHILISGEGKLICGPEEKGNSHQLAEQTLAMINDSTLSRYKSSSGYTTFLSFIDEEDGEKGYVYYNSPNTLRPWRIAVVSYHDEVFAPLLKMGWINLLLTLAGVLILAFIIQRAAKNITKLQQANAEREHIDSELNIARKIQMDMVPKTFPPFPERNDLNVYGSLVSAKVVGGDLYDFFIRDEKLYFCIGDVSGKGVPGALVMAAGYTLYRSSIAHESNPSRIMQTLNDSVCKNNESNMFVTMFIGVLDLPTGKLRYCNAGHDRPFIVGKEVRALQAKPHLPLGVMDDMVYTTQEELLTSGEMIFLYTDGLTEAMDVKHELFGLKRVEDTLRAWHSMGEYPSESIINNVSEQVAAFVKEAEQSDDLTMLAIQYTPQRKELLLHDTLTLKNKLSEITKLNTFVKSATDALHFDTVLANKIKLGIEEAVTNVIEYAYPADDEGDLEIEIEADVDTIKFIISDMGAEFDPTNVGKADTTLSVEDRPIGGLGILLVRNIMNSINYERTDGKNILTLSKDYNKSNQ